MSPWCSSLILLFLIQLCVALHYPRSGNGLCSLKGGQCLPSNASSLCNPLDVECEEGNSICCKVATQTKASLTSKSSASCSTGPTDLSGDSGYISVWSSDPYQNGLDCWWTIFADAENTIDIVFYDFEVEGSYPGCPYDYVEVYDDGHNYLLGQRFCGDDSYDLSSSSSQVTVHFHSDWSVQKQGFILDYWSGSWSATCSGTQYRSGSSGSISVWSGNLYESNLDCWWSITVGAGNTIDLDWLLFELEGPTGGCPYDYVEIHDNGFLLGPFCGNGLPFSLTSSSNEVSVHFHTDGSVQRQGFILQYS